MKQRFLYIMALLLTAATGAWAQDDSDLIDLTPGADGTEWTLAEMPAFDLELEVTYYTDEEDTYTLYGTYEGTTATTEDPFYYVNIDGDLSLGNNGTVTVGAYRWIMRVESKFGPTPAYARGIHFVGGEDSETTGISEERRVKSEALDLWSLATEGTQEFATAEQDNPLIT